MPKKPCEVKFSLVEKISQRATAMALASDRINSLIESDGIPPMDKRSKAIKDLINELHECMNNWARGNDELEKHRASHGC